MKLLLWDFDGTLAYRQGGLWSAALLEVLERAAPGLAVSVAEVRPHLQTGFPWHTPERPHPELRSADEWWEAFYPVFERALEALGLSPFQSRALARQVRPVYTNPECWRLYDDTVLALDSLSASGWSHVVLSNHVPELREIVEHLGLGSHLAAIYCSAETGYEKPHPESFRMVLADFPQAEAVWMIGDSLHADVEGARAVGIPAILVRSFHEGAELFCEDLLSLTAVRRW